MKIITILLFCYIINSVNAIEILNTWKSIESFEDSSDDGRLSREIDSYDESLEDVESYSIALEDIDGVYEHFDGRYRRFDDAEVDRCAPTNSSDNYVITDDRLSKIRSEKMYWYFDKCSNNGSGDYQTDVHSSMPQIHTNFNFELPFFGSRYNYTRVSMNGYLEFTDPPKHYTYPLTFPVKGWPEENDPSFIGIFYSKCRIGSLRPTDIDQRKPGVYLRVEENLQKRNDKFGVELRERVKLDIREGIAGSDTFHPEHAVIVTWKNMSYAGGIDQALYITNTFQIVLATDETATFAIFNYEDIQWTSYTEAGGDTATGEGGIAAFVGFNAGDGVQSFEYTPYSQSPRIRQLLKTGGANGFPGRHIFRIDNNILYNNNIIRNTL